MNRNTFRQLILLIVPAFLLVGILSAPIEVAAQGEDFGVGQIQNQTNLGDEGLITIVSRIINIFLGLLGIIALVLILYGGYKWMTAGGNEEQIEDAKKILINATIGLAIIMASFAIANFVINQFSQATRQQAQQGGGAGGQGPLSVNYGGNCNPNQKFYVQSITPSTGQGQDSTHIKNIKVRAVFSQPPSQNSLPTSTSDWMTIKKDGSDITGQFNIKLEHNRHIMVAEGNLLDAGNYSVSINKNLKGSGGSAMSNNCGSNQATFTVSENPQDNDNDIEKDNRSPLLKNITIGGVTTSQKNAVYLGDKLRLGATLDDRGSPPNNFGGNAFIRLRLFNQNTNKLINSQKLKYNYVGPSVSHGSSDPFNFSFETWLRNKTFATKTTYRAELTGYDIADNTSQKSAQFTVYPSQCKNPQFVQKNNNMCGRGAGASCSVDSDCAPHLSCVAGTCRTSPIISSISPSDGAPGTWVTIKGKYFGNDPNGRKIQMAPKNGKKSANWSRAVNMPRPNQCRDTWSDSWILAQVPKQVNQNTDYAIRIKKDALKSFRNTFTKDIDKNLKYRSKGDSIEWAQAKKGTAKMRYFVPLSPKKDKVKVDLRYEALRNEFSSIHFYIENSNGTTSTIARIRSQHHHKIGKNKQSKYEEIKIDKTISGKNIERFVVESEMSNRPNTWGDISRLHYINITSGNQTLLDWSARGATESTIDCTKSKGKNNNFNATCSGWFSANNISRPGLCRVVNQSGNEVGAPGEQLTAKGAGFKGGGNTRVFFNTSSIQGSISNLTSGSFDTELPRLQPGVTDIFAEVNSQGNWRRSNSVPFSVVSTSSLGQPTLRSIDPTSTTKGSYVTIYGSNFGAQKNEVWMHPQASEVEKCFSNNKPNQCIQLDPNLPQKCGNTWQDDQIIVRVPDTQYSLGLYNVAVQDAFGNITDGQDTLGIVAGSPRPSLCKLSPDSGPAPLASQSPPLTIGGANIKPSPTPTMYFWQSGADAQTPSSWIERKNNNQPGEDVAVGVNSGEVEFRLPTTTSGGSMQSGPIKIKNKGGKLSNSVSYSVQDCRNATQSTKQDMNNRGYRCCSSGPEAGIWKSKNVMCKGQSRNAGYSWRFATADIPKLPVVLEQCTQQLNSLPSPTPRPPTSSARSLDQGRENACINSNIEVQFNVSMATNTLENNPSNVQLLECGGGGQIDCSSSTSTTSSIQSVLNNVQPGDKIARDLIGANKRLKILQNSNKNPKLKPGTWYRVIISDDVRSFSADKKAGRTVTSSYPLQRTRPCGAGTAYCFDFKTSASGETCSLDNAAVAPTSYTADRLGPLRTPLGNRLWYQVVGKGDQACSVISVLGFDWGWKELFSGTLNSANSYVDVTPSSSPDDHVAKATISQNTPRQIDITATTGIKRTPPAVPATTTEVVSGTSKLDIELGVPRATKVWPSRSCVAACPNGMVGAEFNRQMLESEYRANRNILVEKCKDGELCSNKAQVSMKIESKFTNNNQLNLTPTKGKFATGTWYTVTLKGGGKGLKAIGGYRSPTKKQGPIAGQSLVTTTWKFKTKGSMEGCRLNSVDLEPQKYLEESVGGKQAFQAIPRGSPNECNPMGQILNPSQYDWDWKSNNPKVVTTTNFHIADQAQPQCESDTCLLSGSQLTSTSTPVCGDGEVALGEDCDIADKNINEDPGVSCSFNCLRPGNTTTGTDPNKKVCGNEVVDWQQGEECELIDHPPTPTSTKKIRMKYINSNGNLVTETTVNPVKNAAKYCDPQTCLNQGSPTSGSKPSGQNTKDIPVCLSGTVTPGEDCDPSTTSTARDACSASCLNTGSQLTQEWCKGKQKNNPQARKACRSAVSICGNGILEPSEECEVNFRQGKDDRLWFRTGNGVDKKSVTTTGYSTCSSNCMLKDICANKFKPLSSKSDGGKVDSDFALRCDPSDPGCSSNCRLAGSSLTYPNSSVCADAKVGTGEYPQCEISKKTLSQKDVLGNPKQIGTAVGRGKVSSKLKVQTTTIVATTTPTSSNRTVVGESGYALQCGFETYDQPKPKSQVPGNQKRYNNCSVSGNKSPYDYGVADNTCCYIRPQASEVYPGDRNQVNTGICRNTQIYAKFPTFIDRSTLQENIIIARKAGRGKNVSCDNDELDISTTTNKALALKGSPAKSGSNNQPKGFWNNLWHNIKSFFTGVFSKVFATQPNKPVWCQGGIEGSPEVTRFFSTKDDSVTTSVKLKLEEPLASSTEYAVIYKSGKDGIKDYRGVSIRGKSKPQESLHEAWTFKTGKDICKVKSVNVKPNSRRFTQPNSSTQFTATPKGSGGQKLQQTSFYDWRYNWGPTGNPAFDVEETTSSKASVTTTAEGEMQLRGSVVITKDESERNKQTAGTRFSDQSDLTAVYCQVIWPTSTPKNWKPYTDGKYNYSFYYCSDAGDKTTTVDDLPLLKQGLASGKASKKLRLFKSQSDSRGKITATANNIEIDNNYLYLVNGKKISTYNISKKRNPIQMKTVTSNFSDVGDLISSGRYLYAFSGGSSDQVEIYNIESNGKLTLVGGSPIKIEGAGPINIREVEIDNDKLYLGTSNNGLQVDIATSTDPQVENTFSNSSIGEIEISDNVIAFRSGDDITVADRSDITNSFSSISVSNASHIEILGDTLAVAVGNSRVDSFDISDPDNIPPSTNSINISGISDVDSMGLYLMVSTGSELQIVDMPGPFQAEIEGRTNQNQVPMIGANIDKLGNYVYTFDSGGVQILNVEQKSNPRIPLPSVRRAVLDKKLFLSDENSDAIGVQVFNNPKKKEVAQWYRDNFQTSLNFRNINVDDYRGITNGTEYYISALNVTNSTTQANRVNYEVYHNIYNFSINRNADEDTKEVLKKIINNLRFNTNLEHSNQCMNESTGSSKWTVRKEDKLDQTVDIRCSTDFDCRDNRGLPKLEQKSELTAKANAVLQSSELNDLIDDANQNKQKITKDVNSVTTTLADFVEALNEDYQDISSKKNEIKQNLPSKNSQPFDNVRSELPKNSSLKLILKDLSTTQAGDLIWTNGYCANTQEKLKRDWSRLKDLRQIETSLQRGGAVPLRAGSYIPHYTNSKWPSWQTLSQKAGSPGFPVDPINRMIGCDISSGDPSDIDPSTCWNPASSTFHYPEFSKFYEYRYNTSTSDYKLFADFEFLRP